MTHLAGQYSLT